MSWWGFFLSLISNQPRAAEPHGESTPLVLIGRRKFKDNGKAQPGRDMALCVMGVPEPPFPPPPYTHLYMWP